jgi:hypothetical protein
MSEDKDRSREQTINELVDRWFDENFRGSAVALAGSDAWNVAFAAKDDLKKRLRAIIHD